MSSTQFNLQNLLDETLNDFFSGNRNEENIRSNFQNVTFPLYDICYTSLFNMSNSNNNNDREAEAEETKSNSGDSMPDLIPLDNTSSNINANVNNNIEMSQNQNQNQNQNQQFTLWSNLVEDYNAQIQTYQHNITSILRITENMLPVLRNNTNSNNIPRPRTASSNNNTNRRHTLITQLRDWFRNNELSSQYVLEFENLPIFFSDQATNRTTSSSSLTTTEIQNATDIFINDSSNNPLLYNTCPISLEEFRDGEPLMKINHCGHIFKAFELQRWFLRNTKCPSCRYDIRSTTTNNTSS
jgi:hypothetical protein